MWITKTIYVDTETGEKLARDDITKKRYIIKKKYVEVENRGTNKIKIITYECNRGKQGRLFD